MSLMSVCGSCGSDWCSNCDCVREEYKKVLTTIRDSIDANPDLDETHRERAMRHAKDLLRIFDSLDKLVKE